MSYFNGKKLITVNETVYMGENINLDATPNGTDTSTNILAYTEDKGIYLGTDTGHWYYWNGTQYVDGGTYQATEIADNSINGNKLSELLITNLSNLEIPYDVYNGFLNSQGTYSAQSDYKSKTTFKIKCKENEMFFYKGVGRSSSVSIIFYQDNTILSTAQYNTPNEYILIKIPNNCNYVIFSSFATNIDDVILDVYKFNDLTKYIINKDSGYIENKFNHNGFLNSQGDYSAQENYKSKTITKLNCKENDKFLYKGVGRSSSVSIIFYQDNTILSTAQYNTPNDYVLIEIPNNCNYVTFSSFATNIDDVILDVYKFDNLSYEMYINSLNAKFSSNILNNKKWVACGDSFTHGDFTSGVVETLPDGKYRGEYKVYPFIIGNRTNANVINMALNGMTMATKTGLTNCFTYNDFYKTIPSDADYITLYFGINDANNNISIGTINDSTTDTFYGALNIVIEYIITNYHNAKLGVIITNGTGTTSYPQALINVCKKWGVPYLDINGDSTLPYVIRTTMRDGLSDEARNIYDEQLMVLRGTNNHPNGLAHEKESYMIQQFLERL